MKKVLPYYHLKLRERRVGQFCEEAETPDWFKLGFLVWVKVTETYGVKSNFIRLVLNYNFLRWVNCLYTLFFNCPLVPSVSYRGEVVKISTDGTRRPFKPAVVCGIYINTEEKTRCFRCGITTLATN